VRCEARLAGLEPNGFPRFHLQLFVGEQLWSTLVLVEALFPLGPLGRAAPSARRAFLERRGYIPGAGLAHHDGRTTLLTRRAAALAIPLIVVGVASPALLAWSAVRWWTSLPAGLVLPH